MALCQGFFSVKAAKGLCVTSGNHTLWNVVLHWYTGDISCILRLKLASEPKNFWAKPEKAWASDCQI